MTSRAEKLGVTLQTKQKVVSVEHRNGQVSHLGCEGEKEVEASNIILTTSHKLANKLVPFAEETSLKKWEQQAIPVTAACLDLGLRRLPNPKYQFIYGVDQPILMVNASRFKGIRFNGR